MYFDRHLVKTQTAVAEAAVSSRRGSSNCRGEPEVPTWRARTASRRAVRPGSSENAGVTDRTSRTETPAGAGEWFVGPRGAPASSADDDHPARWLHVTDKASFLTGAAGAAGARRPRDASRAEARGGGGALARRRLGGGAHADGLVHRARPAGAHRRAGRARRPGRGADVRGRRRGRARARAGPPARPGPHARVGSATGGARRRAGPGGGGVGGGGRAG